MERYRPLLRYAARHKGGWALIVATTLMGTLLSLAQPLQIQVLVDNVLGGKPLPHLVQGLPGTGTPGGLLAWVVLVGLGLFAANSGVEVLSAYLWVRVGQGMVFELTRDLFAGVQRQSLRFHSTAPVGDTMSRVTDDSWAVHTVTDQVIFGPLHAGITAVGVLVVMARIDARLTLLSLAVVPVTAAASLLFGERLRRTAHDRRAVETRMQSHVHQTLAGIPVVQAYAQEERQQATFRHLARAAIRAEKRGALAGSFSELGSGLATVLGAGVVLLVGGRHVLHGTLSTGALLAFVAYLAMLESQLKTFSGIHRALQDASAKVDRVLEVLDAQPEVADPPGAPALPAARGHVVFEGVSFSYDESRPVLADVSLEARPGEVVAIVGATGAGKSTLVSLASLRTQVSLVLQDSFLFPISVAANIAYGRPDATGEEIEAAAMAANAHEFITALADGYDTVVGERGSTLSGGERQRVAIARALLKNAPVLILDEPTSALDANTESLLMEALERLMAGRTTLIIAHRLSTIRNADRIVVLDGGTVVESGTHDELVARGGIYAGLGRLGGHRLPAPAGMGA